MMFQEMFENFMQNHSKKHKKTWKEDERTINYLCSHFFKKKATTITKQDIQKLHNTVGEKMESIRQIDYYKH